ncbi:cytochrome P450 [Armillaria novae-zelandiae]|uniref:Cytochrome P450 n=1 Tax=Armillaria novae-zelandiae TaxID=153914 RepID=A0AA39PIA5_9AGAR|nr:cytochrome P450 [Armillaria novae-zelandiae]
MTRFLSLSTEDWQAYAIALVLVTSYFLYRRASKARASFPPGPRGWTWPILGNILDFNIDQSRLHLQFSEWKLTYGDIVGLKVAGQSIIVLNSRSVVLDLLGGRAAVYSDRPSMPFFRDLIGWDWVLPLQHYGREMHLQRRMIDRAINTEFSRHFYGMIAQEARILASCLVSNPQEFDKLFLRMTGRTLLRFTLGNQTDQDREKTMVMADALEEGLSLGTSVAGAHLVDLMPSRNISQCLDFVQELIQVHSGIVASGTFGVQDKECSTGYGKSLSAMEKSLCSHSIQEDSVSSDPSMLRLLVEQNKQMDGSIKDEKSIKAAVTASYTAGAVSGTETLRVFVLAMMRYPDVQRKAQALIDAAIGRKGLPTLDDRPSLPYIEAILKETLRWKPVSPLAFPHRTTADDVYKGYFIPKGSTVLPNSWQCLQDEGDYPDPENFLPERFCDSTGSVLLNNVPEPRQFAFGYGRRVCPGRNFAENILWVNIATLLSVFDIRRPDGQKEPRIFSHMGLMKPEPFECLFVPRSEGRLNQLLADK